MNLEEEFIKLVEDHKSEINAKVSEAEAALCEAVALAEKYGIPFCPTISFLSNSYFPRSFSEGKFSSLDSDIISEITGAWDEYNDSFGWQYSAVCY